MALQTIKIRVRPGDDGKRKREIEADVRGLFGFRRGTVTHVPTGYGVYWFASKAQALRFMALLNAQQGWDFTTQAEYRRRGKRLNKQAKAALEAVRRPA